MSDYSYVTYSINNVLLSKKVKIKGENKNKILKKLLLDEQDCFYALDQESVYNEDYDYYGKKKNENEEYEEYIKFKNDSVYKSFEPNGFVTFDCSCNFDAKTIKWYSARLNEFGLVNEIDKVVKEFKGHKGKITTNINFKVPWLNSRLLMLATLCSLRYLQENPFPLIIEYFYKAARKCPKIDKFHLFQLSHNNPNVGKKYPNENHSLVEDFPGGGYGGDTYYKFIDLEQFKKNCKFKLNKNDYSEYNDNKNQLQGLIQRNKNGGLIEIDSEVFQKINVKKCFDDLEVSKLVKIFTS